MLGSPDPRPPLASPLALALARHHNPGGDGSDHLAGGGPCTACGCQCHGQQPSRNLLVILPPTFKTTSLDRILAIARETCRDPALDIADLTLKFAWATPDSPPPAAADAPSSTPKTFGPATLSMFRVHMTHLQPALALADIMHLVVQSVRRRELKGVTIAPGPAPAPVPGGDSDGTDPWRSATFGFTNYNAAKSCFHWLTKVQAGGMVAKATVPGAGKVVSFWSPHIEIVGGGEGETVGGSVRSESVARERSSSGSQVDAHRSSPPVIPAHELFASRTSHASDSAIDTTPSWATSSSADEPQAWTSDRPTWASQEPEHAPAWASNISEPAPGWVPDVPDPMPAWASAEPDSLQPSPWAASQLAPSWATRNSDRSPTWPAPTTAPTPAPDPRPASPARAPSPPPAPPARWAVTISNIDPRAKANTVLGPILDPVRGRLDPVQIRQLGVNQVRGRSVKFVFADARAARRFVDHLCARKMARGLDGIAVEGGEVVVGSVERDRGEDRGE